jgi:myo-inositol-1(or 4)-monophosphatase
MKNSSSKKYIFIYFQLIRENISRQKTVLIKSCDVDLVTETDQMVEKLLINGISAKFPDHK